MFNFNKLMEEYSKLVVSLI